MRAYFRRALLLEGTLRFKMSKKWVWLDSKNSLKQHENSLKQLKTASTDSPSAYIREGLLSQSFLQLRFGGLIFSGGLILGGSLLSEFYGMSSKSDENC